MLVNSGYNNNLAIENIQESDLERIENYANEKLNTVIKSLNCCFADEYKNDINKKQFKFLPGHRTLILSLPEYAKRLRETKLETNTRTKTFEQASELPSELQSDSVKFWEQFNEISLRINNEPAFSNMLCELITNALKNFKKTPNQYRYSEIIKHFSTYVYMMCGRNFYETISRNLPIPAASTVCMYYYF